MIKKILSKFCSYLNLNSNKIQDTTDFYLHNYKNYDEYKKVQIYHNKRKIEKVFADKKTLNRVGDILVNKFPNKPITGLCHGSKAQGRSGLP